ncbi:MAG: tetratricopeptide repeat protein [Planctomycetes bacterium]|nr:tetratricopeptide repeat protein [Planctomycetota bacterium]
MKNKILLFGILLVILTYAAVIFVEDNNELADVYYQSGLALFKQNKHDEAVEKFNKALSYKRDFSQALFKLGECHEKLADSRSALNNYRLCLRCLKQQKTLSREENELLAQVNRCIDKLDTNGADFKKIKNDYITGLLALASDCFNKKQQRLTFRLAQNVLEVDEANKSAKELTAKIDKKIIASLLPEQIDAGPPKELFNGKDIKNWGQGTSDYIEDVLWRVAGGRIIGDPKDPTMRIALLGTDRIPNEYLLTIKFSIQKYYVDKPRALVTIINGRTSNEKYSSTPIRSSWLVSGENEIKLIRYAEGLKLIVNGKTAPLNEENYRLELLQIQTPLVGITVSGAVISIKNITVQEVKKPAQSKTPDPSEGVQGKKPATPPSAKKSSIKEIFNGKSLVNWVSTSNDPSETECWIVKAGKIVLNTKKPETKASLLWNDPPTKNYKLTVAFTIGGAPLKDKFSAIGFLYGKAGGSCDGITFYSGQVIPASSKIEVIKNGNSYKLLINDEPFNEFSGTIKPPAIGFFAQNIILSISSIKIEELKKDTKDDE